MSHSAMKKFEEQKREIEQRTLDRTIETLKILDDTEKCGVATAEQLVLQGGQFKKIDQDLDEINNLLQESQKNINGIKSRFGSLKSLFGKKNKSDVNQAEAKKDLKESKTVKSGLKEKAESSNGFAQNCTSPATHQKTVSKSNGTDFDSKFSDNMDGISASISRLKGLAGDMGNEIDSHNSLIKKIQSKVEVVDVKMDAQNKEMRKIIGK